MMMMISVSQCDLQQDSWLVGSGWKGIGFVMIASPLFQFVDIG
jgi:hypothetical protein